MGTGHFVIGSVNIRNTILHATYRPTFGVCVLKFSCGASLGRNRPRYIGSVRFLSFILSRSFQYGNEHFSTRTPELLRKNNQGPLFFVRRISLFLHAKFQITILESQLEENYLAQEQRSFLLKTYPKKMRKINQSGNSCFFVSSCTSDNILRAGGLDALNLDIGSYFPRVVLQAFIVDSMSIVPATLQIMVGQTTDISWASIAYVPSPTTVNDSHDSTCKKPMSCAKLATRRQRDTCLICQFERIT